MSEPSVPVSSAGQTAATMSALPVAPLRAIGHALLCGARWEDALNDPRWRDLALFVAYTHDKLGAPDDVDGVFFSPGEADAMRSTAAQRLHAENSLSHYFYKPKILKMRLSDLAAPEKQDGFYNAMVACLVTHIKTALGSPPDLPAGVIPVSVGLSGRLNGAQAAYIDITGKRVVLWQDIASFSIWNGSADFTTSTDPPRSGLMNGQGEILVPPIFDTVGTLSDGLAVAMQGGKAGYIDASGAVIVPLVYEYAQACFQERLLVKQAGGWGALDLCGNPVIPHCYDALEHDIANASLRAVLGGRHGYLSLDGALLVGWAGRDFQLADYAFSSDWPVYIATDPAPDRDASHFLVDARGSRIGNEINPENFASIQYNHNDEGLLVAARRVGGNRRYGYLNLRGQTAIPFQFGDADDFSEGLAAVTTGAYREGLYGYIDRLGQWAIPAQFASAGPFHGGLAHASGSMRRKLSFRLVSHSDLSAPPLQRYGYIDRLGHWIIAPQFLEARPLSEGLAAVRNEKGWLYIDCAGQPVTENFDEAHAFQHGIARVGRKENDVWRYGLIDLRGQVLLPLRFEWLSVHGGGLVKACDEHGLWGCLTPFGEIVLPCKYHTAREMEAALMQRRITLPG